MPPLIDRTLLRARVPPIPRFHHLEYDPPPSLNTSTSLGPNTHKPSTVSVFKITQNQLNTLKAKSWEHGNKTNYSTYIILAAYIWRCATKARGLSYDQPTKLNMPINGRPRLHPPSYQQTLPDITAARRKPDTYQCPNLNINKRTRLSTYDADFGWGRPIYMGPAKVVHEGKLYILSCPTDDGSLSVVACLQTAHMKLFEKHLYEGLKSFDKIKARY
ncbi:shikimate O-hydroxycinnamoyltransferase-like [Gossypium hirsutum]|uniref:Shikimate O-hydroxycinnamoyltransferase-like n=1 Tax=Gossypium hirsutum TaxID=3635 RepID=A0A1U8PR44_GOSHI|nr:shikimate O-hydroxycinnamoyltransferase-like [Gossypium hirsutum]